VYVSTIVDSRNRTATYASKDVPSSTTDQTGLHLVKNIEDDGYGTTITVHQTIVSYSKTFKHDLFKGSNRNTSSSSFLHLLSSRFQDEPTPGTLILVRHGNSNSESLSFEAIY
jgi:hypothetical protein